jgi:hypothetical protein
MFAAQPSSQKEGRNKGVLSHAQTSLNLSKVGETIFSEFSLQP